MIKSDYSGLLSLKFASVVGGWLLWPNTNDLCFTQITSCSTLMAITDRDIAHCVFQIFERFYFRTIVSRSDELSFWRMESLKTEMQSKSTYKFEFTLTYSYSSERRLLPRIKIHSSPERDHDIPQQRRTIWRKLRDSQPDNTSVRLHFIKSKSVMRPRDSFSPLLHFISETRETGVSWWTSFSQRTRSRDQLDIYLD